MGWKIKFHEEDEKWYEKMSDSIYYFFKYNRVRDWYRKIINRFFYKYYLIDTGLPRDTWCDTEYRMLHGMMVLLKEFIEEEKPFEHINWDSNEYHRNAKKEMLEIYEWWNNYKNRQDELDKTLHEWSVSKMNGKDDFLKALNEPDTEETKRLFERHNELEDKLDKEEEEMLIRLIKIRHSLWT